MVCASVSRVIQGRNVCLIAPIRATCVECVMMAFASVMTVSRALIARRPLVPLGLLMCTGASGVSCTAAVMGDVTNTRTGVSVRTAMMGSIASRSGAPAVSLESLATATVFAPTRRVIADQASQGMLATKQPVRTGAPVEEFASTPSVCVVLGSVVQIVL